MACSIESRVPFLDHELVEFAATVPDRMKLRGGVGKYILKRAVEDILPREIVYRKKMGFPTPLRQWLMEPSADALIAQLHDRDGLLAPYIDFTYLNDLLARHKSGLEDATDRIWRLLNLQLWGNIFITSKTGVLACQPHEPHPPGAHEPGRDPDPRRQSFSRRWSRPPACRLIPPPSTPSFPEPPPGSLDQAEKICQHRFDLLGYKDLDFGTPIDWHFDPVHQKRAPRKPWHEIPFLDFDRIGDHKVIWELNRHQHLVTLAQAGFPRRDARPVDALAERKPLPHRHQLGEHAGGRIPRSLLALGAALNRRFSPRPNARSPPPRLVHRAFSVHIFLSQYPLTGRRRSALRHRRDVPANCRCAPLARPRLENRPATGRSSGPSRWLPLRAVRLLPHLRS